jgi:hypothetical protein
LHAGVLLGLRAFRQTNYPKVRRPFQDLIHNIWLYPKIATADIVCASVLGAEPVAIWSRPAARGLAANVIVVTFEITSRADRRRLSAIVGRLNGEDGSLSPEPR